ncbi:uncharacterized protein LOC133785309 [Humulus lupulus]|uniref:uncharacterized protein LOC133785309 n=1 Tax=Humulus lupulus TaxID=3486 RepID=UPI002B417D10|nr:uncharacterized protein LOC133785309 [Humulus lupulus]
MTINELTGSPRHAAAPAPPGKGKKKATEPILESSDENDTDFMLLDSLLIPCHLFDGDDMLAECAFDLYTKSASKKKSHKRQSGEGCSNRPTKKPRIDDPPTPTPTREATPPPAPTREATPPTPTNPDPPSPVRQTPPLAPIDPMPPASTVQHSAGHREENAQFEKRPGNSLSAAEAQYTEQLKAAEASYAEQLKTVEVKHSDALKEVEAKHTEAFKEAEEKHLEALQLTEAKITSFEEEVKRKDASIAKITASKEQYKEVSLNNY